MDKSIANEVSQLTNQIDTSMTSLVEALANALRFTAYHKDLQTTSEITAGLAVLAAWRQTYVGKFTGLLESIRQEHAI